MNRYVMLVCGVAFLWEYVSRRASQPEWGFAYTFGILLYGGWEHVLKTTGKFVGFVCSWPEHAMPWIRTLISFIFDHLYNLSRFLFNNIKWILGLDYIYESITAMCGLGLRWLTSPITMIRAIQEYIAPYHSEILFWGGITVSIAIAAGIIVLVQYKDPTLWCRLETKATEYWNRFSNPQNQIVIIPGILLGFLLIVLAFLYVDRVNIDWFKMMGLTQPKPVVNGSEVVKGR